MIQNFKAEIIKPERAFYLRVESLTWPTAYSHHRRPTAGRNLKFNGLLAPFMGPCDHRAGLSKPLLIIASNFNKRTLVGGNTVAFPGIAQSQSRQWGHRNDLVYILKRNILPTGKRYLKGIFPFIGLPGYPFDGPVVVLITPMTPIKTALGYFVFKPGIGDSIETAGIPAKRRLTPQHAFDQ